MNFKENLVFITETLHMIYIGIIKPFMYNGNVFRLRILHNKKEEQEYPKFGRVGF